MLLLSELRPNNLYMVKNSIVVALEDHLNDGNDFLLYFHGMPSGVRFDEVRPIPLTDDWLTQLGLKERYVKGEWSWSNCTPKGEWSSNTEIVNHKGKYEYMAGYPPIEYVHQLQNLYAALTREELSYKPELLKLGKEFARIQYLENGLRSIAEAVTSMVTDMPPYIEDSRFKSTYSRLRVIPGIVNDIIDGKH
jgi:hypothetical protein